MALRRGRPEPLFRRTGVDTFEVNLSTAQRDLIDNLLDQLHQMLDSASPALRRLFPEPYGSDSERNAGYAVLAGAELLENRVAGIKIIRADVFSEELSTDQMNMWMRAINDLRLVIGTILNVTEESGEPEEESAKELYHVYEHLGFILEHLVSALGDW